MAITPEQQAKARRAIAGGRGCGDAWAAGGPLSLIAEAEGVTRTELERWDTVANGDGPLTVRRVKESGNAFGGWPLSFLEALESAWKGSGGDADVTLAAMHRWLEQPTESPETTLPYEGKERRSALMVAVDIKSILFVVTVIAPLLGMTQWIMSVRQDVRSATLNNITTNARVDELERRMAEQEKAKLLYCSGRREAAARDTNGAIRLPDAGC